MSKFLEASQRNYERHMQHEAKKAAAARARRNARISKLGVLALTLMERGDLALIDRLEGAAKDVFAGRPKDLAALGLDGTGDSAFEELREQALVKDSKEVRPKEVGGPKTAAPKSPSPGASGGGSGSSGRPAAPSNGTPRPPSASA